MPLGLEGMNHYDSDQLNDGEAAHGMDTVASPAPHCEAVNFNRSSKCLSTLNRISW